VKTTTAEKLTIFDKKQHSVIYKQNVCSLR